MTNKERDEILISLVKAVNNLQVTVNEIRSEMKNMITKEEAKKFATKEDLKRFATKEDLKKFVTEDYLKQSLKEQKEEISKEVCGVLNIMKETTYEYYSNLEKRVTSNENEINKLKLAMAN